MARFSNPDDIRRILLEMDAEDDENEVQGDEVDFPDDIDYEPQFIEHDDHNSDTEEELEEAMEEDECLEGGEEDNEMEGLRFYLGKNGDTIWANKPLKQTTKTKSANIIKTIPGPKGEARNCQTRLDCFLRIISPQMIDEIVKYTNIHIAQRKTERKHLSGSTFRDRDYRPTSPSEIKAVFGALYLMAVKRGNRADISEFFTKNGTGLIILRANFSERRFRMLLRSLRFDDINSRQERSATDKLAPIRDFQTAFVANCQGAYNVGESVTIDEMLVAFRGRCSFIQYMPKKPAKYGLKIYCLCDSQTFYTYNMMIYCGTQRPGPYSSTSNKPFDIVTGLCEPLKKSGRNITTDNWFSSYPLAEYLLSVGLTFLGTLRSNKAEIPPEFVQKTANLIPGNHLFGCNDVATLISYATKKKKFVLVLSTLHDEHEVDEETSKPVQIMDYNATKGGVDSIDLMCSRITTSRRTQRWPMVIFFRDLDIAGINSMRIYGMNKLLESFRRHLQYIYELALELMEENLRQRAHVNTLPKDLKLFLTQYREQETSTSDEVVNPRRRSFCYICGSKKNHITKLRCSSCKKSVCKSHSVPTCDNCLNLDLSESDDE